MKTGHPLGASTIGMAGTAKSTAPVSGAGLQPVPPLGIYHQASGNRRDQAYNVCYVQLLSTEAVHP